MIKQLSDLKAIAYNPFRYEGSSLVIEIDKNREDEPYLCFVHPNSHAANIKRVDKRGIHWYTFFLGKRVRGIIPFSALPKPIINENQLPADSL